MRNIESHLLTNIKKTLAFYFERALFEYRSKLYALHHPQLRKPIFVIGCSRSGTTPVYQVLSASPKLASLNKESHAMWEALHPLVENSWSHRLTRTDATPSERCVVSGFFYRRIGNTRLVDKANQNCFRIPYLHGLFEDAFFVFVKRSGPDNINSLIHGWARPAEYGTWSADLPEKVRVENGQYRTWCFFLFEGWRSLTKASIEEVCAKQWIEANEAALKAKQEVPQSQWAEIRYEDLLCDTVQTFKHVFDKLSLPFDGNMKRFCSGLTKNPTNAFSRPRLNKWKEEHPERIHNVLPMIQPMMNQLGYNM